ncbi:MAG: membrane dipeptidase [Alphaproteobacteria bacterium]|nr:membrane dipeptidase [Alphaproteobacteria bacterium]
MTAAQLHRDLTVFDGLILSAPTRAVFEDIHRGGITAANFTCSIWEDFRGTMQNVAKWKNWITEHHDILRPVHSVADIRRAKAENKVGVSLGWQNCTGIDDQLGFLQIYKALGVGFIQLTYNTQNLIGTGCYESRDSGLSDFGREAVHEMNRVGIAVDLSHVGSRTCAETIRHSKKPVCYTHTCPRALRDHPRNKSDEELRLIADHGGFIGVTRFTVLLRRGQNSDLEDYLDAIEHTIDVAGEQNVGIGTDMVQDQPDALTEYCIRDKGYARQLTDFGTVKELKGLERHHEMPNVTAAMLARGWSETRVRAVMGENWLRYLTEVWGE